LDDGDVEGRFFWKHELEGDPDAVIQISDNSFRFDAGVHEVLVYFDGELRRRCMWPFILVYFWSGFVEVVDEIMLAMSMMRPRHNQFSYRYVPRLEYSS